jgi:hypothetical protein
MKARSIVFATTAIMVHSLVHAAADIKSATALAKTQVQPANPTAGSTLGPVKTAGGGLTLINPVQFSPNTYSIQELPLDTAAAMGGGVIVGTIQGVASVYVNGQVYPLPGKSGYTDITPTAISSNGYIVGYATSGTNVERGLFWTSYTSPPIDIGALDAHMLPQAVNSSGVVVGYYHGNEQVAFPSAFTWSLSGGLRSIAPANSYQSSANSISDTGYVGGVAWYGDTQAVTRWYPGLSVTGSVAFPGFATGVLDDGTVFGYTTAWNLSDQPQNILPPNIQGQVYDLSSSGRTVGITYAIPNRAWTVPPGGSAAQILPLPDGASSADSFAIQVEGCGAILGYLKFSDTSFKAVLWTKLACDSSGVFAQGLSGQPISAQ